MSTLEIQAVHPRLSSEIFSNLNPALNRASGQPTRRETQMLHDIQNYIRSGETESEGLGLEIEHFVVDGSGVQIPFEEISYLINLVGRELGAEIFHTDGYPVGYATDKYTITLEPSCQFEISISPYQELYEIERVYQEFLSLWEPLFEARGYRIVARGLLPLVEQGLDPDDIPLSPKKRYKYMDTYFRESGNYGKYMMRSSASTQVSVDYRSEEDLVKKLRILQKISPILMIMMENKSDQDSTLPGGQGKPHLLRTQEWEDLDPARTGFYPNSLDPDFGYGKIAEVVLNTPLILLTDKGWTEYVGSKTGTDLLADGTIYLDESETIRRKKLIEHFISMGFFHFRIKKYIEIRVADSVPLPKALGYAALLKGIVYSRSNLDVLDRELSDVDDLGKIQDAVSVIESEGENAVIYHGKTAAEWAERLAELAKNGLSEQEKEYLVHV